MTTSEGQPLATSLGASVFTNLNRPTGLRSFRRPGQPPHRAWTGIAHATCAHLVDADDWSNYVWTVEDLPRDDRRIVCEGCGQTYGIADYQPGGHRA